MCFFLKSVYCNAEFITDDFSRLLHVLSLRLIYNRKLRPILNIGSVCRQGFGGTALNKFWLCLTSMEPADAHAGSAGEEQSDDPRCKHGYQLEPCCRHDLKLVNLTRNTVITKTSF